MIYTDVEQFVLAAFLGAVIWSVIVVLLICVGALKDNLLAKEIENEQAAEKKAREAEEQNG